MKTRNRLSKTTALLTAAATFVLFAVASAAPTDDALTDAEITRAVYENLEVNEVVSAHLIDVEVIDGVATLDGTVEHLLAKSYAAQIASSVRGVRSVVNLIEVVPIEKSDAAVKARIETALMYNAAIDADGISVAVVNGVVKLEGEVKSYVERTLAAREARGTAGVKRIENNISVTYDPGRSDEEIKTDILRIYEIDPVIPEEELEIEVDGGNVVVKGYAESVAEKKHIRTHTFTTGVRSVNTEQIEVNWKYFADKTKDRKPIEASDDQVTTAIIDALFLDPRTQTFDITVTFEDGLATLIGTVDNLEAKRAATQIAENTYGVANVENRLLVRPDAVPVATTLERRVEDALAWDPIIDRHNITVTVRNAKVYLYGNVDNNAEKWRADDVAAGVEGVVEVANYIEVNVEWRWKSDEAIKEDVEDNLFWSLWVESVEVDVSVEEGAVTLTGVVDNMAEVNAAINNAYEAGAKTVISNLAILGTDEDADYANPTRRQILIW
ncbi:MAG: BON domain-containing protein [Ignavibacteriales bacterium]|nr:BON domain-containing protein [Ignavibacteriales bacterium]